MPRPQITSELIRAARALLRWEQRQLAEASSVSLPTVKRLEAKPGNLAAHVSTVDGLVRALEAAGVEFTNGEQPGVRLTKATAAESAKLARAPHSTVASKAARRKMAKATEKKR
jgi:transcriptional regulator with XRE-family HTH domain